MERLTKEKKIGAYASLKDRSEAIPDAFTNYDCLIAHMMAVTRLKDYEDTGLTPEEINHFGDITKMVTPEHLRELLKAEKDGRLFMVGTDLASGKDSTAYLHEEAEAALAKGESHDE